MVPVLITLGGVMRVADVETFGGRGRCWSHEAMETILAERYKDRPVAVDLVWND